MPKNELIKAIDLTLAAAVFNSGSGASGTSAMERHDLNGPWHDGLLDDAQAPQFLLIDGTRALTGNLTVNTGITIDGVDISVHAANANAHHDTATAGTGISLAGQVISLAAGAAGAGLAHASGVLSVNVADGLAISGDNVILASSAAGAGLAYASGVLSVNAGSGLLLSGDNVAVGVANTGAVGLTVEADAIRLTSSSAPGAAAAVLASTAAGGLTLKSFIVSGTVGDATLDGTGNRLSFSRLGANYVTAAGAGGTLRLGSNGTDSDLIVDGANARIEVANSNTLRTPNYVSQLTGWAVTYAGAADYRYIYTDELHAKAFIADLEQALAGGQIICKSVSMLGAAFTCPAAGAAATLTVKDLPSAENMAVFESGDIIRLRVFSRAAGSLTIADCWGVVTSYADQANKLQTWTFTRSSGGNAGSVSAGTVIATDSIVLDYGTTGNGYHEVNAIDGLYAVNSPYSQVVTWTTHPATGQSVRTRLGNLKGITGTTNEYGLYAGTGITSSDQYLIASNLGLSLVNVDIDIYSSGTKIIRLNDTDGLRFRDGDYLNRKVSWANASDTTLASMGMLLPESLRIEMISPAATTATITLEADGASYSNASLTLYSGSTASAAITAGSVDINVNPTNGPRYRSSASYYKIWNESNDGASSGLDADTVDGYEASGLMRLDSNNTISRASPLQILNSTSSNQISEWRWMDNGVVKGQIRYAGTGGVSHKYFGIVSSADYLFLRSDLMVFADLAWATNFASLSAAGLGIGMATEATDALDIVGTGIRIRNSRTPATAASAGNQGTICWSTTYIYVCTATNTWKRAALATW